MKTIHIIIILVLVVAIGVVISTLTDAGTYSDFTEASKNMNKEFHIIGKLDKSKPVTYDAKTNANEFTFFLIDDKGVTKEVVYHNAKPQDFEKSEKVVIIGEMQFDDFIAKILLLKCPS